MSSKAKWCLTVILAGILGIMMLYAMNVGKKSTDEFVSIILNVIERKIPTDKDLEKLDNEMEEVIAYLGEQNIEKGEIATIYQTVETALVCSEANRSFNELEEKYLIYVERSDEIQNRIADLEVSYSEYTETIDNIPPFAMALRRRLQEGLEQILKPKYADICEKRDAYISEREAIDNMYISAKKIADDFFEEYYELMCHIVNAEAGWLDYSSVEHLYTPEEIEEMKSMERCKVARIMELRVKHPAFKQNTIRDVVYAPGQYAPVSSGTINREPYPQTRIDMENFLRGRVDTGLPENVVYQALFPQGSGVYEHSPSGHYFCYH